MSTTTKDGLKRYELCAIERFDGGHGKPHDDKVSFVRNLSPNPLVISSWVR
jgi:hypothetical protein